MTDAPSSFAATLKRLRAEAGLNVTDLARLAGLSRETIYQLERGRAPDWATVQKLAAALGVSTEAFRDPPA